ncbi:hypothetical protein ACFV1L_10220 [Kitasatospora sp. NPDC059646]|uniref:hypothetical protein n=1 Tax=Kitasatospora sp. NPDC059646 TaxID=3346893 RepID=UPI0036991EDA
MRRTFASVVNRLAQEWSSLGSWRGDDVKGFQRRVLPALLAGERRVAALTTTYLEAEYRRLFDEPSRVAFDLAEVTGSAVRNGVDPVDVYERPFKEVWTALSNGEPLDVATERGANRLETLAKTDLQRARTLTAQAVMEQQPRVTYYVRELQGEYDCALCLVASTQRYRKADLLPIHPGCDCRPTPVRADFDPGQVIDEARLEAIHKAVEEALGTSARDARSVDYSKIIVQHTHGEIGPVLGYKGQRFTGPEDLRIPK